MSFSNNFTHYNIPVLFNGVRLPEFKPSKAQYEYVGVSETVSNKEFLTELCRKGFREKVIGKIDKSLHSKYADQVKEELRVIDSLGFIDYILMVWDICDFCRRNEIPTGPGRGSVASSIICYLVGITKIDSIKNGLFFTRFLNPSRAKTSIIDGVKYIDGSLAPDIDQDLCFYRRNEVIEYLNQKYPNRTAKLLTTGSLTTKILLKEVLKCYEEASESEANEVSELVEKQFGIVEDLGGALSDKPEKENKKLKEWAKNHPAVIDISLKLRGLKKSVGCHASAVLIAHDEIVNLMPLQLTKGEESGEYTISNSCDMYTAQELTLKFDELGLKTASVIHDCCKAAGIKVDDINPEDPIIYQWLQDAKDMYGIFQFESEAQGRIAQQIKPKNFQQISDALAISRPGAVSGLKKYLDYIHNGIYNSVHPIVDDVLKETGGNCLEENTLVKTKTGFKKIKDIVVGDEIYSINSDYELEIDKVKNHVFNGKRDVFEITLSNGIKIEATKDHKFLSESGNWIPLSSFKAGDFLASPTSIPCGEKSIDEEKIRIIGYLIADGALSKNQACFICKNKSVELAFKSCVQKSFPSVSFNEIIRENGVKNLFCKKKKNGKEKNEIVLFMEEVGLAGKKSHDKNIPNFAFSFDEKSISILLAALWDCDGSVKNKFCWSYKTISYQLASDIQKLLLLIGVNSYIYCYPYKNKKRKNRTAYQVSVYDTKKLREKISTFFKNSERIRDCKNAKSEDRNTQNREILLSSIDFDKLPKRKIERELGLSRQIFQPSKTGKRINAKSYEKIKSKLKLQVPNNNKLNWNKILSIEPVGEKFVYDIEVEKNHNFIGNLIMTHNCLFQEQYLKMLVNVGMNPNNAELARRTLGKKKVEEIPKVKKEIEEVCEKNGIEKNVVDLLLRIAEESGGYQFARAHSSSYATITAQTIYLKVTYPVQFYWACLKMTRYDSPKDRIINVARIKKEMDERGIKLLPPSLSKSEDDHTIDNGSIRIGLSNVKGVAGKAIEKIHGFKAAVDNKFSLFAGIVEAGIPINLASSLIMSGCFDEYNQDSTRNKLIAQLELYKLLTPKEKPTIHSIGPKYNYNLEACIKACVEELKDINNGKPLIKESRRETIRKNYKPFWEKYLRNSRFEELTKWIAENEYVGFAYSGSLKSIYSKHIVGLHDLKTLKTLPQGDYKCVAQITEIEKRTSKNKKDYIKYTIKDDTDSLTPMLFNLDLFDQVKTLKESSIVVMHLSKKVKNEDSIYFVSDVVEQEVPTVLKVSTIRKELEKEENK